MNNESLSTWLIRAYYCGSLQILPIELIIYIHNFLINGSIKLRYRKDINLSSRVKEIVNNSSPVQSFFGHLDYHEESNKIVHIIKDFITTCEINNGHTFIDIPYKFHNSGPNHKVSCENDGSNLIIKRTSSIDILDLYSDYPEPTSVCKFIYGSFIPGWLSMCKFNDRIYCLCRRNIVLNISPNLRDTYTIYSHHTKLCSICCIKELNLIILGDFLGTITIFNPIDITIKGVLKCANDSIISLDYYKKPDGDHIIVYTTTYKFIGTVNLDSKSGLLCNYKLIIPNYPESLNNTQVITINDQGYILASYRNRLIFYNLHGQKVKKIKDFYYCRWLKHLELLACLNDTQVRLYKIN